MEELKSGTHLENGIHLYSFSEEGLNKSLKILDNRKVKLIAAVKEAIELVEDKPGIWVIMNGANNQNESYRGTVTLIGYLLGNEDNQLS